MPTPTYMKDFYFKFDSTPLTFWPASWSDSEDPIETLIQSEGGTDMIEQTRTGKLNVEISLKVQDTTWVKFFKEYERKDSFQFYYFDVETNAYKNKTCRLRNLRKSLVKDSEQLNSTKGVWEVSFTITEF